MPDADDDGLPGSGRRAPGGEIRDARRGRAAPRATPGRRAAARRPTPRRCRAALGRAADGARRRAGEGNAEEWLGAVPVVARAGAAGAAARCSASALRYRKVGPARFIGTRELTTVFAPRRRRAGLPLAFSQRPSPAAAAVASAPRCRSAARATTSTRHRPDRARCARRRRAPRARRRAARRPRAARRRRDAARGAPSIDAAIAGLRCTSVDLATLDAAAGARRRRRRAPSRASPTPPTLSRCASAARAASASSTRAARSQRSTLTAPGALAGRDRRRPARARSSRSDVVGALLGLDADDAPLLARAQDRPRASTPPTAPARLPRPPAARRSWRKQILINSTPWETRVALLEDTTLVELHIERARERGIAGNIYKGKVVRVLPGHAGGVRRHRPREGGLPARRPTSARRRRAARSRGRRDASRRGRRRAGEVDDATPAPRRRATPLPPIEERLQKGEEILVQVAKEPIGTKGARVTSHISLPGPLPRLHAGHAALGISRRIEDEAERDRLRDDRRGRAARRAAASSSAPPARA